MNEKEEALRPMLHAFQLQMAHPTTGEPLKLEASPPDDLVQFGAAIAGCEVDEFKDWLAPRVAKVLSPGSDPEFDMHMEDLKFMEELDKQDAPTHVQTPVTPTSFEAFMAELNKGDGNDEGFDTVVHKGFDTVVDDEEFEGFDTAVVDEDYDGHDEGFDTVVVDEDWE